MVGYIDRNFIKIFRMPGLVDTLRGQVSVPLQMAVTLDTERRMLRRETQNVACSNMAKGDSNVLYL